MDDLSKMAEVTARKKIRSGMVTGGVAGAVGLCLALLGVFTGSGDPFLLSFFVIVYSLSHLLDAALVMHRLDKGWYGGNAMEATEIIADLRNGRGS